MGGYVMITNRLFLGKTGKWSMGEASGSTIKVSRTGNSKVPHYILPFSVMFHIL